MKYWAYLNDDVSQKPFTEEELQQIPGFGPDILICSEVSAVSRDPEWRPVKEVLPHLIRPKAPDFSKFRPKPPVPPQQENANVLPIPQTLPTGVSATPFAQQAPTPQDNNIGGLDNSLLAQLRSLTSKIESLENKIDEQEKELIAANQDYDQENEETFVSEPQNEQEDDVLEVPFDSDFEVPFDASKSSEEIAREAEEMLSKPNSTEIEEYDTDDQSTELLNYNSDMQKILEDTIRQSNFYGEQPPVKKEKKRRTFIAEDLISKKTLNLSESEDKKDKKESADKKSENKEENKENISQEQHKEENKAEEVVVKSDEKENLEKKTDAEALTDTVGNENQNNESQDQNQETTSQLTSIEDAPKNVEEQPVQEEEKAELQLTSVEEAPKGNKEEPIQEEETAEPQLTSVEDAPENKTQEPSKEEEKVEPQLVSVEDALSKEAEEPVKEQVQEEPKEETQEEQKEEPQVEPETEGEEKAEEPVEEDLQEVAEDEYLKTVALDELAVDPDNVIPDQYNVEEEKVEEPAEEEQVQEEPKEETQEEQKEEPQVEPETEGEEKTEEPVEEQVQEESSEEELKVAPEQEEENKSSFEEIANKVEVPADLESTNLDEKTANLSKTQEITLSEDETTAAVLSEIAEEKAQDVKNMTTSDQLFAELEHTYRNEDVDKQGDKVAENKDTNLEVDLSQDIVKEDEFLKTFTTSVEEVFLDQPTAIISDYVPPTDNVEHTKPEELENSVKREKPSDIKTVPLVPEVLGQEIHSSPYVESATAKLRKTSPLINALKWGVIVLVVVIIVMAALSGLAVMGKIPEGLSPIHKIIYSLRKPQPQQASNVEEEYMDEDLAPEVIDQEVAEPVNEQPQTQDVVNQVKNYTFPDGTTLENRIQNMHGNLSNEIEWSLISTEENGIYSIAVKIPQNKNGQGFSYRFNYDLTRNILVPTTSEAKNIMENYSR